VFNLIGPGLQDRHLAGRLATELAPWLGDDGRHRLQVGPLTAVRDYLDVTDAAGRLVELATALATGSAVQPAVQDVGSGLGVRMDRLVADFLDTAGLAGRVDVIEAAAPASAPDAGPDRLVAMPAPGAGPVTVPLRSSIRSMLDYAVNQLGLTGERR
jgi:nucleoside-diphosphate-sugar epimerase